MRYLYFESVEGDLLEAFFYAPEVKSSSYRARSVGFCALRLGAECATPVDRVLSARAECFAPVDRMLCTRGLGGAALELGDLCDRTVACATVGRPMLQLGGGGF